MILLYATFATVLAALVARIFGLDAPRTATGRYVVPSILGVLVVSTGAQAAGLYEPELVPPVLYNFIRRPMSPDTVPIALRIRADSAPGDTLAVAGIARSDGLTDDCILLASISGVPCFLSRPSTEAQDPSQAAIIHDRLAVIDTIDKASEADMVQRILRENRIGWYFVPADLQLPWAGSVSPAMKTSGGTLYRVAP